jgi:DNA-binding response OmpR family regulator
MSTACTNTALILCVDDYESILDGWRVLFSSAEYEVLTAADWKSALCLFKAEAVDLVILDQEIPCVPSAVMARAFKNARPAVPILLAVDELPVSKEDLDFVDAWILKSARVDVFLSGVGTLLAEKCNAAERALRRRNDVAVTPRQRSQRAQVFPATRVA